MAAEFNFFPFESGNGAFITEPRWKLMFTWMRTVGVLTTEETLPEDASLFVAPTSPGLAVEVYPGEAFVQGMFWSHTGDPYGLSINGNTSGNPRIDLVVLRTDFVSDIIEYIVIQGTPDPSPVAPDPVQNSTVWDLPLATVDVANEATEITDVDITDVRVRSVQGDIGSSAVTLTNAGTTSLVNTPAGPNVKTKGLVPASGIAFSTSSTDIAISSTQSNICILRNSADIVYTNGTSAAINFDTEEYDPAGMHSTSVNPDRINILEDGIYYVTCGLAISGNVSSTDVMYITIYGVISGSSTSIAQDSVIPKGSNNNLNCSRLIKLAAGDYVIAYVTNSSNETITVKAYGAGYYQSPIFSAVKVSNNI